LDGILVVDKPRGITSRQVVNKVGRHISAGKVGHAGTLDPLATGVLILCIGRGTLLSRYLSAQNKTYEVDALLGVETDTYDIEGKIRRRKTADGLGLDKVERALDEFRGSLIQKPPPYSAVKHNGKPLYYYARRGLKVEPRPRKVNVDSIGIVSFEKGSDSVHLELLISCGSGTYIRSIVNDLGRGLGCGACVFSLRRKSSGDFSEDSAMTLEELLSLDTSALMESMVSLEDATRSMPGVSVAPEGERRTALGEPLLREWISDGCLNPDEESIFRISSGEGDLIALYGPPRTEDGPEICGRAVRVIRPLSLVSGEYEPA
jgi:tRNA pseudouridine55 synthase